MTETYKRGVSWNWELLHHCSIDRVSNETSWLSQFKRKISRIRDIHHQLDRLSHFVEFQDGKQHHNRSEIYTFIAKKIIFVHNYLQTPGRPRACSINQKTIHCPLLSFTCTHVVKPKSSSGFAHYSSALHPASVRSPVVGEKNQFGVTPNSYALLRQFAY